MTADQIIQNLYNNSTNGNAWDKARREIKAYGKRIAQEHREIIRHNVGIVIAKEALKGFNIPDKKIDDAINNSPQPEL